MFPSESSATVNRRQSRPRGFSRSLCTRCRICRASSASAVRNWKASASSSTSLATHFGEHEEHGAKGGEESQCDLGGIDDRLNTYPLRAYLNDGNGPRRSAAAATSTTAKATRGGASCFVTG